MADVVVDANSTNPETLMKQGIKAFVLEDYSSAVQALGKASELLVTEHEGDDLHDSLGEVYIYYGKALLHLYRQESGPLGDAIPKVEDEDDEEDVEEDNDANEKKVGEQAEEKKEEVEEKKEEEQGDKKEEEQGDKKEEEQGDKKEEVAEDQEDATDLQVAWEVLELAKKIFERRGEPGRRLYAECLTTLGEISLESENFDVAIEDLRAGLDVQLDVLAADDRQLSETWYNLGMAYATNSQIEQAADAFQKSLDCLERRIRNLVNMGDVMEIGEIRLITPDLVEKIREMRCYKQEALEKLTELAKGAGRKPEIGESSSSKPTNNITHLVKRKRKSEENEPEGAAKKPAL